MHDIFIYTKYLGQGFIKTVKWLLDILKTHRLFANLKKCQFHKNKICFLDYILLVQRVKIEDKQIIVIKN